MARSVAMVLIAFAMGWTIGFMIGSFLHGVVVIVCESGFC